MLQSEDLNNLRKELVILKASGLNTAFETRIVKVEKDSILLKNPVPLSDITSFAASKSYSLQVRDLTFTGKSVEGDGVHMRLLLDKNAAVEKLSVSKRKSSRFYFQEDQEVFCTFTNPVDQKTVLQKKLVDMSTDGFSLLTFGDSKLFSTGLVLSNIRIHGAVDQEVTCDAEVRYAQKFVSLAGAACNQIGLEITHVYKSKK